VRHAPTVGIGASGERYFISVVSSWATVADQEEVEQCAAGANDSVLAKLGVYLRLFVPACS